VGARKATDRPSGLKVPSAISTPSGMTASRWDLSAKPWALAGVLAGFRPQARSHPSDASASRPAAAAPHVLRTVRMGVGYTEAMHDQPGSERGSRLLIALGATAALAFVAAIGWITWRGVAAERPAQAAAAPAVPRNLLLSTARPVPAPALDLPTGGGGRFALSSARGQVVVVVLWATWCPPCIQEMPSLVSLGRDFQARHPGKLRIVAVSLDDRPEAVEEFFAAPVYGGRPPELAVPLEPGGGPVSRAFPCAGRGACRPEDQVLPEAYIIDQQGRIAAFVVGGIDWTTPGVRKLLEALLAG